MRIAFDFDGSLDHPCIQDYCRKMIMDGHDAYIVTTRMSYPESNNFDVYEIAEKLHIPHENVYFTDMEWKYQTLIKLEIDVHVDDCMDDIRLIHQHSDIETIFSPKLKYCQ